jgi:hypothetical protein
VIDPSSSTAGVTCRVVSRVSMGDGAETHVVTQSESEDDILDSRGHVTTTSSRESGSRGHADGAAVSSKLASISDGRETKGRSELMSDFVHRVDGVGHGPEVQLLQLHLCDDDGISTMLRSEGDVTDHSA